MSRAVKRVLSLALALALTGVIGASASPSSPAASAAPFDFLVGGVERSVFGAPIAVRVSVSARSGANAEEAFGHFSAEGVVGGTPFPFSGRVTCLRVDGNRAVAGGVVTKSEAVNAPVGSGILLQVTDNGVPGAGRDTNVNFVGFGGSDPEADDVSLHRRRHRGHDHEGQPRRTRRLGEPKELGGRQPTPLWPCTQTRASFARGQPNDDPSRLR
jgi:hypothetical protein